MHKIILTNLKNREKFPPVVDMGRTLILKKKSVGVYKIMCVLNYAELHLYIAFVSADIGGRVGYTAAGHPTTIAICPHKRVHRADKTIGQKLETSVKLL